MILTVIMTMRGCEQTSNMQGMNSSLEIVAILIMNREYSSQFLVAWFVLGDCSQHWQRTRFQYSVAVICNIMLNWVKNDYNTFHFLNAYYFDIVKYIFNLLLLYQSSLFCEISIENQFFIWNLLLFFISLFFVFDKTEL